jgi:AAA family ATP:ADP antiporter
MFVQRFAKALAVGINLVLDAYLGFSALRWLSSVAIVLVLVWLVAARYAGSHFEDLSEKSKAT